MGGLRLGMEMMKRFFPESILYTSAPDYPPHKSMAKLLGIPNKDYRYYNKEKIEVDIECMLEDFNLAPDGSFMLIQPCGHNPTGMDPTKEQWDSIIEVMVKKNHFPFFDMAYHGIATGCFEDDAYAVRAWGKTGKPCFLS